MEVHASRGAIAAYFFYKMPYINVQMVPVAALISVIIMFSLMKKTNEITAVKACGISIPKFSFPVVWASMVLAIAVFLFSELIVPYASSRSESIWHSVVKKEDQNQFYGRDHIWYKGSQAIYRIPHFDTKRMVMGDPTFYFFDDFFHLTKRIKGRRAVWTGDRWRVEEGAIQVVGDESGYDFDRFRQMDLTIPEKPDAFLKPAKRPEEMSYWQLKRFAKKIQFEGYDATRYLVDMNIKLAFPLINLVMVLTGIPIALGLRRGGTPLAVSLGVGVCFLYLVNFGVARSLGLSGVLPPYISAWVANIVFFLLGIYLMMRLKT
jgi:lipopolysaccharide export system permease protein